MAAFQAMTLGYAHVAWVEVQSNKLKIKIYCPVQLVFLFSITTRYNSLWARKLNCIYLLATVSFEGICRNSFITVFFGDFFESVISPDNPLANNKLLRFNRLIWGNPKLSIAWLSDCIRKSPVNFIFFILLIEIRYSHIK